MARVPLSGTNIRFLSGVPFTNDYKHTRWFDKKSQQTAYFKKKKTIHEMNEANFQRIEGFNFIKCDLPIDDLWHCDYVMFQNKKYNSKWFYGFVTKLEYKQRNNTQVYFELDVFQTWLFDIDFKPSFVNREHQKLWKDNGDPVVNTLDEGLNYGNEYENVDVRYVRPYNGIYFLVMACKKPIHSVGNVDEGGYLDYSDEKVSAGFSGVPTPINYYILPFKFSKDEVKIRNVNEKPKKWKPRNVLDFMDHVFENDKAVNNVVSLYISDIVSGSIELRDDGDGDYLNVTNDDIVPCRIMGNEKADCLWMKKATSFDTVTTNLGNKYDHYRKVKESKLLMYPYTQLVLDDFRGNRVTYRNEYIRGRTLDIEGKGSAGTSQHTSYGVQYNYDIDGSSEGGSHHKEMGMIDENGLLNTTPNDLPIINDNLAAFIQGNKNTVQNQQKQIMFGGLMDTAQSTVGGIASAVERNPAGVISSGLGAVRGMGNAQLQMQGLNAKIKDIDNKPPSMAKQGSNASYSYGNGYKGLYVIKKQIKKEYQRKLEDYFNMFGYKQNEVKKPNFHTRKHWNYIQTEDCIILGDINNEDLNDVKKIFNDGVILWHTDDIGNFDKENDVIS